MRYGISNLRDLGFSDGSPIYDCDPEVIHAIAEARLRVRGSQVFEVFWKKVLSLEERSRLGDMEACFVDDGFAPNHLARIRNCSIEHAIVEIAFRANFLTHPDYLWLLESLGVVEASGNKSGNQPPAVVPDWNRETGIIQFDGHICRRIRRVKQATAIVPILDQFQAESWPEFIVFPDGGHPDPQRIHQVVRKLNENLEILSFSVQDESICWNRSAS